MALRLDFVGSRYGYLTGIARAEPWVYHWRKRRAPKRFAQYLVRCDCGTEKVVKAYLLRSGHVKSCGCKHWRQARASCSAGQAEAD